MEKKERKERGREVEVIIIELIERRKSRSHAATSYFTCHTLQVN